MLCARRGESWYVMHTTRYPSSLRVAAADAPARPVPTTITVYFRLFAGLTNRMSNLCRSHLSSSGPGGTRDCKVSTGRSPEPADEDGQRDEGEAHRHGDRDHDREWSVEGVGSRSGETQRADRAPGAVVQVEPQGDHRRDVEQGDGPDAEPGDQVGVNIPRLEGRVERSRREMQQVEDDEHEEQHAAPPHGAGRERRDLRPALGV